MWRLIYSVALAFAASSALAQTSVWEVSDGDRKLYVGGTMHLLSATDYPLPEPYMAAYHAADVLVFETDIGSLNQPHWQQQMAAAILLPRGRQLGDVLRPETWAAVQRALQEINVPVAAVQPLSPAGFVTVYSVLALRRAGLEAVGVDEYFFGRAAADGKPRLFLEAIQEQIDFLANMGRGKEDALVLSTLEDVDNMTALLSPMVAAWRDGELDQLDELGAAPMREEFPELYDTILVQRNLNWLPRLEAMLATDEIEYVLVGALHLAGEDGVLAALRSRGFTIRQLR